MNNILDFYTGVVKHIGDMLRNHLPKTRNNIIVIGIAPWGVICGRESLIQRGVNLILFN